MLLWSALSGQLDKGLKTRKFHVSLDCWWDFPLATPGDFLRQPHPTEEPQEQARGLLLNRSTPMITARSLAVASHSEARRGIPEGWFHTPACVLQASTWQEHGGLHLSITGLERTEARIFSSTLFN